MQAGPGTRATWPRTAASAGGRRLASPPYRWEFSEGGRAVDVAVEPEGTTNDMGLMIRMACAGGGLTFGMKDTFSSWLQQGQLVPVLEEYCPTFPGFFLYYPSRRNLAPKLRALVDHIRRYRRSVSQ